MYVCMDSSTVLTEQEEASGLNQNIILPEESAVWQIQVPRIVPGMQLACVTS